MNIKPFFIALAFVLVCYAAAYADQPSSDESLPENKCNAGGAMDQFECYSEYLERLEKKMNASLIKAQDNVKSMWGKEAVTELKERIQTSQKAWFEYRDELCMRNYYKKAPVHPPSLSLEITACKFYKTEQRLKEIEDTYLSN